MARRERGRKSRHRKVKVRRRSGVVGALWGIFWGVLFFGAGLVFLSEYGPGPGAVDDHRAAAAASETDTDDDSAASDARVAAVDEGKTDEADGVGDTDVSDTDVSDTDGTGANGTGTDGTGTVGTSTDNSGSADDATKVIDGSDAAGTAGASTSDDDAETDEKVASRDRPQIEITPESKNNPAIADLLGPQIPIAGPALEMNARAFKGRGDAGLLSVVLYTDGDTPLPGDAIAAMSMPLTLAIDPKRADDRRLARSAKERGHEILAVLPLAISSAFEPEGLTEDDGADTLEVGTAETLVKLNMAIGAVAPDGADILDEPDAMSALLKPVAAHSFIWVEPRASSRSAAAALAARSDLIFLQANVFVEPMTNAEDVYRKIEDAAAQARLRGTAVIFIEASQEALRAIVQWGFEKGGRDVVFAPISAIVLKRGKG